MAKTALDAIDRKILKYLIKNARMPFLEIARECGISGAAIHQRIRKLDESGVILGSRLIVDPKMMGFDVCAHISITLKDPQLLKQTVEELRKIPEIVEAHFITGKGNILVKLYCVTTNTSCVRFSTAFCAFRASPPPRRTFRCRRCSSAR